MPMSKRARRRIVALLVIAVVASAGILAAVQWRANARLDSEADAREQAFLLYEQDRYREAMNAFNEIRSGRLREDPEAMAAMADMRRRIPLENARHLGAAIGFAQQALVGEPDNRLALDVLLEIYGQTSQITELIDIAERLIELEPTHREALWSRAQGLAALGRPGADDAIAAFIDQYPDDVRGHGLRLQRMLAAGAGAEAVRQYADEQAEARPRSAEFLLLQAEARVRTSAPGAAFEDLRIAAERVADIEIERPESLARIVQLLDLLGLDQRASEILNRELAGDSDADAQSEAVAIAIERDWKSGRIQQARARAIDAARNPDEASDAALGWSVLLAPEPEPQGSDHPNYRALQLRDSAASRFWVNLIDGRDALESGDWGAARGSLQSAIMSPTTRLATLVPTDVAEYLLGRADFALGSWREAAQRWEDVALRNPGWFSIRIELANLLLDRDRPAEALEQAGRVLSRRAGSYPAAKVAARSIVRLLERPGDRADRSEEALALLQEMREAVETLDENETAEILALETRVRLLRGELDLAQRSLSRLVELVESGAQLPGQSLVALIARAENAGLAGLDAVADASAQTPAIVELRARKLAEAGRADEARGVFREAIQAATDADRRELERRRAIWLVSQNDPRGFELLQEIADANPRDAQAQIDLLNASEAWSREEVVMDAVVRLRSVGGESSMTWRIYEARRLLTFNPTERAAGEAVDLLSPGLRSASPDAAALALAGEAMLTLEDRATAADYYGRAIDADPERIGLYPRLITILQAERRAELAEARLREFAQLKIQDPALLRRRAELAASLGLWDIAAADRRALAQRPGAGQIERAQLAATLAKTGRVREADAVISRLVEEPLSSLDATAITAEYLAARDRVSDAVDVIERSTLSPEQQARLAAQVMAERGMTSQALAAINSAIEAEPTAGLYASRARLLLDLGRADDASQAVSAGLELDPDSSELAVLAASASLRTGEADPIAALERLAQATASDDLDPALAAVIEATRELSEDEDLDAYISSLETLVREHPGAVLIARLLAAARLQAGDIAGAVRAAEDLARVQPELPDASRLAAEMLATAGRFDEAEAMARRWLAQANDPLEPRVTISRLALAQGEPNAALDALSPVRERILAESDAQPQRVEPLVRALARLGRIEEAQSVLAQLNDGRFRDALFVSVAPDLQAPPDRVRAWLEQAPADDLSAEETLQLADAWFQLAGRTREPADFRRVESILTGIENVERTPGVIILAVAQEQLGKTDDARRSYRQALELFPGQPVALNNLAYLLTKAEQASEEPVELARQAIAGARRQGYTPAQLAAFHHTLGAALEHADRADEAIDAYREGLAFDPVNHTLLLALAELHAQLGQTQQARSAVARMDPESEAASQVENFDERYETLRARLASAG
jgi:Tfp pilus assembly protein PilF